MLTIEEIEYIAEIFADEDAWKRLQSSDQEDDKGDFFTQNDYDNLAFDQEMAIKEAQLNTRGYAFV